MVLRVVWHCGVMLAIKKVRIAVLGSVKLC